MNSAIMLRRLLVLAVGILPAATAQICNPKGTSYSVESQSDLDKLAEGCTTINGSLDAVNYSGPFKLPNVKNISSIEISSTGRTSNISSIEFPDLEFVDRNVIVDLKGLASFSAPKLKKIPDSSLLYSEKINLKSLEEVDRFIIGDNVTSLQLDSLKHVYKTFSIGVRDSDSDGPMHSSFDLSLPSLETIGSFELMGSLSSFEMPKLSKVTGMDGSNSYFQINCTGKGVDLSFPQLSNISDIGARLRGDIASLSMPKLDVISSFGLETNAKLDVKLHFEKAEIVNLQGQIASVELPNLKSAEKIRVDSKLELDCDAFESAVKEATGIDDRSVSCASGGSQSSSSSLTVPANAAFGVMVGVIALLVTF